jgi:hypothetical protein
MGDIPFLSKSLGVFEISGSGRTKFTVTGKWKSRCKGSGNSTGSDNSPPDNVIIHFRFIDTSFLSIKRF